MITNSFIYINNFNKPSHNPGADPRGGGGRAPDAPPPPKIGKNMIFWRKIVIFHTKYTKYFRASRRSAQFFLSARLSYSKSTRCFTFKVVDTYTSTPPPKHFLSFLKGLS